MAYGTIKVDTVTFTDGGIDKSVTLSGLVQNPTFSGNVTVTGTLSGVTVTGTTASFTSGVFTNISGGTHTITSGVFAAGSAASPSISFVSDPDTGVYSPGANQVALSTNGTGRLFVDASGNVTVNGGGQITSRNVGASPGLGRVQLGESGAWTIEGLDSGYGGSGAYLKVSSGASERLRITSDGKVGVGTSTPAQLLDVAGVARFGANATKLTTYSDSTYAGFFNGSSIASNESIYMGGGNTYFYNNGSPSAIIDSSGNVLINNASALGKLSVSAGTSSTSIYATADNGYAFLDAATNGSGARFSLAGGTEANGVHLWGFNSARNDYTPLNYGASQHILKIGSTERARLDASGRLLVGTSTARSIAGLTAQIQLEGTSYNSSSINVVNNSSNTQPPYLTFGKSRTGSVNGNTIVQNNDYLGIINFAGADGTDIESIGARIAGEVDGTPGANDMPGRLVFSTTADGASSPTERMRIDASGNVGIGSISPGSFQSASSTVLSLRDAATNNVASLKVLGGAGAGAIAEYGATNGVGFCGTAGAHPFTIYTNSQERLRITADGKLGVGVSSPSNNFQVAVSALAAVPSAGASGHFIAVGSNPYGIAGGALTNGNGYLQVTRWDGTATNYDLLLQPNGGRVGIGTASPSSQFAVSNGGAAGLEISPTGFSSAPVILSYNRSGAAYTQLTLDGATNVFAISGTERARIDSSGRLGVGTSSPAGKLHVIGNSATPGVGNINISNGAFPTSGWAFRIPDSGATIDLSLDGAISGIWQSVMYFARATGNVGIGTTSPSQLLTLQQTSAGAAVDCLFLNNSSVNANTSVGISFGPNVSNTVDRSAVIRGINESDGSGNATGLQFLTNANGASPTEKARIDSSGRLLVGTSSARSNVDYQFGSDSPRQQLEVANAGTGFLVVSNYDNTTSSAPAYFTLARAGSTAIGSTTIVANDNWLGEIDFAGSDGTDFTRAASIRCEVDGTPGANDMPGRLVFSTTADGASSPTERMRINQAGAFKASVNGSYVSSGGGSHEFNQNAQATVLEMNASNASYQNSGILFSVNRSANSVYTFFDCLSGGTGGDFEFRMKGDGNAYADGSWTGGGADYAEYFEWSDSNPNAEDRRGISVVLDGNKIREAIAGEDPIGVISGNPSVVGDAAWNKWSGKYLRDEFGAYIQEDYEVEDEDGNTVVQQRRKLNPAYDPDAEYIPREQRPEWDCVGLMGKLRIRKGQITGSRWIKMRDISASVEEWLVR